jgi:hypothetical protein
VESALWIKLSSSSADLTIYAGDFNTEPKETALLNFSQRRGIIHVLENVPHFPRDVFNWKICPYE